MVDLVTSWFSTIGQISSHAKFLFNDNVENKCRPNIEKYTEIIREIYTISILEQSIQTLLVLE